MSVSSSPAPRCDGRKQSSTHLVLGLGISGISLGVQSQMQALGWKSAITRTNLEASRKAHRDRACATVLTATSEDESVILTAAKLKLARPHMQVIILGPASLAADANHAGATLLPAGASVPEIMRVLKA
jgi:hypothetical protein